MTSTERDILVHSLRHLGGYVYNTRPGASKDPTTTDCSRFAFAVLVDTFGEHVREKHGDLHIVDASRPFSNVDAIEALGIGRIVETPVPGRFHYFQGWKGLSPLKSGHTTLWFEAPVPLANECFVLQATPLKPPWVEYRTWAKHSARWNFTRLAVLGSG